MKNTVLHFILIFTLLIVSGSVGAIEYSNIIISDSSHPAVKSAARLLAQRMGLAEGAIASVQAPGIPGTGEIVLTVSLVTTVQAKLLESVMKDLKYDGYAIAFHDGGVLICGVRPRSLLFAAADVHQWKDKTSGTFVRDPSFAIRSAVFHGDRSVAEYVAKLGLNIVIGGSGATVTFKETLPEVYNQLSPEDRDQLNQRSQINAERSIKFAQQCRDADIMYIAFFSYGSNFNRWSRALYQAVLKVYPSVKGMTGSDSFEKGSLCPSDPMTWKIIDAYVKEFAEKTQADGLIVSFWDAYGLYCQCDRCVASGLNKFPNELYKGVKHYHDILSSMGKKLIVRTWSSGVPHWLGNEWVHAPGYDHFGGSSLELWSRVIKELPADIILQTKVYHSDCQPNARYSELLGNAQPHTAIAEYQITGQTQGRFYFPTSMVNYLSWTMKKNLERVGPENGVYIHPGGTRQTNYSLLYDILNSINVYAWCELSWDFNADLDKIWMDWALPIYGEKAAPAMIRALKLSEDAVNLTFSPFGMGSETNSNFAPNIKRRETLLMYTNRHYLAEYARFLEPNKENIQRLIEEKNECLKKIDEMFREYKSARPFLTKEQIDELNIRFNWLKEFAICRYDLDISLWRFRYLRYLNSMRTTDPEQIKYLAEAYDAVQEHQQKLFQYDDRQKLSCYNTTMGNLKRKPSLGSPIPLMQELYDKSLEYVEEIIGPDYLPAEWKR